LKIIVRKINHLSLMMKKNEKLEHLNLKNKVEKLLQVFNNTNWRIAKILDDS